MTQAQWFDLDTDFSYHFAMSNAPESIATNLLKVTDMEVRSGRGRQGQGWWVSGWEPRRHPC